MEWVFKQTNKVIDMKDHFNIHIDKALEFKNQSMESNIKDNGKIIKNKVKEYNMIQSLNKPIKAILKMEKKMEKVHIYIEVEIFSKEIG